MLKKLLKKFNRDSKLEAPEDIGFAIIFDVDYLHNDETSARLFFNVVHQLLILKGFNFEGRIFYRLGSFDTVESALKDAILTVKTVHHLDPKTFVRSAHIIPLSQFTDLTKTLSQV